MPSQEDSAFSDHREVGSSTLPCTNSWIGITLVDEEDQPVPGEAYKITLSDGSEITGALDGEGKARLDGIQRGTCQITFPDLDRRAWERK
jgi:hypothetical protein